jgi:peptidoglycan/LPS O-acetylase OafA/YrhL
MESKNIPYIEKIDHLRFLAASLVFCFHYWQLFLGGLRTPSFIREGYSGITLFFVLSGFLFMKIALSSDSIRYRGFLFNRAVRILPLYFALAFFVGAVINSRTLDVFDVVTLPLLVFGSSLLSKSLLTGAAWTIGVEFTFYLVFPFLAQFTRRLGWRFLAKGILFILFLRVVVFLHDHDRNIFYSSLVGRFDQFLIGMLSAYALDRSDGLRRFLKTPIPFGSSLVLLYFMLFVQARLVSISLPSLPFPTLSIIWPVIEGSIFAFVIASYTSTEWQPNRIVARVFRFGGRISYSFYLLHVMCLSSALILFGIPSWTGYVALDSFVYGALIFGITLILAALSYSTIEEPFLKLRKQYTANPPN